MIGYWTHALSEFYLLSLWGMLEAAQESTYLNEAIEIVFCVRWIFLFQRSKTAMRLAADSLLKSVISQQYEYDSGIILKYTEWNKLLV